jgi:carboxyl-terminal processing protease
MHYRANPVRMLLRAGLCGVLLLIPALAWATNGGFSDKLLREAAELEKKGDWRGAGEIYWRILTQDRQASGEIRQKYLLCLRHVRMTDRHSDTVYRKRVNDLPFSKSLSAYLEALGKLQSSYVDKEKIEATSLFRHGLDELRMALADLTFQQTYLGDLELEAIAEFGVKLKEQWGGETIRQLPDARKAVKEIALSARQQLGIKPSVVVMEFVCGACNALDERTAFLPPSEEYTSHVSQLNALGVGVATNADKQLFVSGVTPGSWAAQMGFKAGDRIALPASRKQDKDEVSPLTDVELFARGESAGKTIKLPESLPSVTDWDILPDGIGYLRLSSFTKTTLTEIDVTLAKMRGMGMGLKALVLDLRGNPGGLFNVSVQVAERFLPEGIIVSTQGQTSRTFESHSGMGALDMPLVVLVDGETASAAEVLAGALKENGRAKLVGLPTYGKGTIQTVLQLADAGGVRITLARFFTPLGQPYNGVGVAPDILESMRPRERGLELARDMLTMRP